MRCLFLPDNLFASIIEEQTLFSSLLSKPFKKIFPIFKTNNDFDKIVIYPPIAMNGFIIRLCNINPNVLVEKNQKMEGFVLGFAGKDAQRLIREIPSLKMIARQANFAIINAKSWYFSDVQYKKIKGNLIWRVEGEEWQKER